MKFLWWAASGVITLAAAAIAWAAKIFVSLAKDAIKKAKTEADEKAREKAERRRLRGDVDKIKDLLGISDPAMMREAIRRKLGINDRVGEEEHAVGGDHEPEPLPPPARPRRLPGTRTTWSGKPPDDDSGE